jgi:2-polyprenyl-3-methyl-5-hydroxy-6-metoxy-1,4-benzoquinol methylase
VARATAPSDSREQELRCANTIGCAMSQHTRFVDLFKRIRSRSGVLTFSDTADLVAQREPPPRLKWARDLAQPIAGRRILDVGCWTGGLLTLLAPLEPTELMGIDLTGPWIRAARETVPSARFLEVATLSDLPPSLEHHFDVVTMLETLEHLPRGSEASAISALAALLAPGGRLILSTPAAGIASPLDPAWILTGHRHYRLATLTRILSSAGLEVQRVHYSGNFWTSLDTFLLYFTKHVLHRGYRSSSFISSHEPSYVYQRRRPTSNNIWLEARTKDESQL